MTTDIPDVHGMTPDEQITYRVAECLVQLVNNEAPLGGDRTTGATEAAIEGVLMGLALLMEQAPESSDPLHLQASCARFALRIRHHARQFRSSYEETGIHPADYVVGSGGDVAERR